MAPLENMSVGAELALVGGDQLGAVLRARRGLEAQKLQLAVATDQQVHLAGEELVGGSSMRIPKLLLTLVGLSLLVGCSTTKIGKSRASKAPVGPAYSMSSPSAASVA